MRQHHKLNDLLKNFSNQLENHSEIKFLQSKQSVLDITNQCLSLLEELEDSIQNDQWGGKSNPTISRLFQLLKNKKDSTGYVAALLSIKNYLEKECDDAEKTTSVSHQMACKSFFNRFIEEIDVCLHQAQNNLIQELKHTFKKWKKRESIESIVEINTRLINQIGTPVALNGNTATQAVLQDQQKAFINNIKQTFKNHLNALAKKQNHKATDYLNLWEEQAEKVRHEHSMMQTLRNMWTRNDRSQQKNSLDFSGLYDCLETERKKENASNFLWIVMGIPKYMDNLHSYASLQNEPEFIILKDRLDQLAQACFMQAPAQLFRNEIESSTRFSFTNHVMPPTFLCYFTENTQNSDETCLHLTAQDQWNSGGKITLKHAGYTQEQLTEKFNIAKEALTKGAGFATSMGASYPPPLLNMHLYSSIAEFRRCNGLTGTGIGGFARTDGKDAQGNIIHGIYAPGNNRGIFDHEIAHISHTIISRDSNLYQFPGQCIADCFAELMANGPCHPRYNDPQFPNLDHALQVNKKQIQGDPYNACHFLVSHIVAHPPLGKQVFMEFPKQPNRQQLFDATLNKIDRPYYSRWVKEFRKNCTIHPNPVWPPEQPTAQPKPRPRPTTQPEPRPEQPTPQPPTQRPRPEQPPTTQPTIPTTVTALLPSNSTVEPITHDGTWNWKTVAGTAAGISLTAIAILALGRYGLHQYAKRNRKQVIREEFELKRDAGEVQKRLMEQSNL